MTSTSHAVVVTVLVAALVLIAVAWSVRPPTAVADLAHD